MHMVRALHNLEMWKEMFSSGTRALGVAVHRANFDHPFGSPQQSEQFRLGDATNQAISFLKRCGLSAHEPKATTHG